MIARTRLSVRNGRDEMATLQASREVADVAETVVDSLRRIIQAVDRSNRKLLTQAGLTGPQIVCLRRLDGREPMQISHLAKAMNLSAATVCGLLNRLEQRGFVIRERQLHDRRRVLVSLTDGGRYVVKNAPPAPYEKMLVKLRSLPARRQTAIHNAFSRVLEMMATDLDVEPIILPRKGVTPATRTKR